VLSASIALDVSGLAAGSYIMIISNADGSKQRAKFSVVHP